MEFKVQLFGIGICAVCSNFEFCFGLFGIRIYLLIYIPI